MPIQKIFYAPVLVKKIRVSKDDVKPQHPQYGKLFSSVKNYTQLVSEQRIQDLTKTWANGSVSDKLVLSSILIATGHAEHTPITSPTDVTDIIAYTVVPKSLKADNISESALAGIIQDVINWMRDDLVTQGVAATLLDADKMLKGLEF
jgi:hypothetical protein